MSVRLSVPVLRLVLIILASAALLAASVRGDDKPGTTPQAAAPAKAPQPTAAAKPVEPSVVRQDGLLRLEEDLSRALHFFKPENEVQLQPPAEFPVMRPQPVPTRRDKRMKDLERRQKDWTTMNPDNPATVPDLEELLKLPDREADGRAKNSSASDLDIYSESAGPKRSSKRKLKSPGLDKLSSERNGVNGEKDEETDDDSNLPPRLKAANKELKKQLGAEPSKASKTTEHSFWSDLFGFGNALPTPEEEKAHKEVMKEFEEKVLNGPTASSAADNAVLNAVNGNLPGLRPSLNGGLPSYATGTHALGYDSQLGTVNPAMGSSAFQDPTTRALNQWNPYSTPQKTQPAPTPVPQPIFDVPRRKFQ
ncbi:MAG: hypothetical protein C5B50_25825 [Verrucomicrobia bacterium]|nr:MAG: hypothetical protein C5B50_25825 [Verrucomicrobiota bacterium]